MANVEERFISYGQGKLRYLVVGSGPPLVLAHGWNGSAENFDTWYDTLGDVRTLLIPDLPGFGESTKLTGRHTVDALSRCLDAVMEDYGADHIDLGGLCLGACVALSFYRRHPEKVDKLILHTPLISPPLVLQSFRRQIQIFTSWPLMPLVAWMGRQRWISDWYKRRHTEGEVDGDAGADINFLNQQRASAWASRAWIKDAIRREDVDLVRGRTDPTLVLVAGDDRVADIPALAKTFSDIPAVTMAIFDNAGHGWSGDFVLRQNAVLRAFLDGEQLPATAQLRPVGQLQAAALDQSA